MLVHAMTAHANDAVTAWAGKELVAASFVAASFGARDAVVEVFGELRGHIESLVCSCVKLTFVGR